MIKTILAQVILDSELLSAEETHPLHRLFQSHPQLTVAEVLDLDLPAKNRVDALLRHEFLEERQLRELACVFAEHTLHVYEVHSLEDRHPRNCVEVARLWLEGIVSQDELQAVITEAIRAVWHFEGTEFVGAFHAGFAATFLGGDDAGEMARAVAIYAQRATHREMWERRNSNLQLMTGREREATWQLRHVVKKIR